MVKGCVQLVNCVWAKRVTHFRAVESNSNGALVYGAVIRDVGE
jgi:hypothetical protein